ncbi:MAG: neutral/alkaline non-lysosomal ceramidase N-terminal domain-containing protein [Gemmatimonadota bacterium]
MLRIGIAQVDITPTAPVWLTGYGNRDHRSEGVYQALRAGALYLEGDADRALVLTADVIGFDLAYAAATKARIAAATGLLPRQIVLTATHTHCGPFFFDWVMPGEVEAGYAAFLRERLVEVALQAVGGAAPGTVRFGRGRSTFGVNRRLPDGKGGVLFAPNPDGPMDRDLDTLWLHCEGGELLGSLTSFGCHPTSLGGYLVGGDYPGYLTRALERETRTPALFATGCGGNVRPWYNPGGQGFAAPTYEQIEQAGDRMAGEVLAAAGAARAVEAGGLRIAAAFHSLPYAPRPTRPELEEQAGQAADPLRQRWAREMLRLQAAGPLPSACPQEIQVLQLGPRLRLVFLGGEVLTEIGLHLKQALQPADTVTVAYSNGVIAYVPGEETYPLGGYEVEGSHFYYLRPAPLARDAERLIVTTVQSLAAGLG